jgi:hypothetical protein
VFVDQGGRHFQSNDGHPSLADRLLAWLRHWDVIHLVADASGVGAGLVDWLSAKMGPDRITGFTFTVSSKATLGASFLSLVETGRFLYWASEEDGAGPSPPLSDGWWFFTQAENCNYSLASGGRFERDLRWGVPAGKKIDTPAGRQPVHDDRLISAGLVAVYDDLFRKGVLRLGQGKSAIIPPIDPLDDYQY